MELNNVRPKRPCFFLKPSSSILVPNGGPVLQPKGATLHYEVELALIMGQSLRDHPVEDGESALDAIAGYAVGIDMTARNIQDECKKKGLPWTAAKGFDTFLPISNWISKTTVLNPHDVELWLNVNGEKKQQDSSALMLFKIPRLLSEISSVMKLEPGDMVLTGTPKGVGKVVVGDVMTAGLRAGGKEVDEARIEVEVEEKGGLYVYEET